jgi:diacylglycerol kinase family enzyme
MTNLGIVVNNKARNAEVLSTYLDAFSAHGLKYTLYKTEPNQLDEVLKKAQKNHSLLLVGGGDGTVRSAAQRCVRSTTVLGILPLGTLNHFAQELSLPTTPEELVQSIINNKTAVIDVAEVNGIVFVNNSSIGFYPRFATQRNYYSKFYNKWLSYIPGFWQALQDHQSFSLTLKSDELNYQLRTSFLMVSNNLYTYEFPLKFARESFNQSQLGIYFFKHGKLRISKLIRYFFRQKTSFEIKTTEIPVEISIDGINKIDVSLDGEVLSLNNPLKYQSLPGSLTLLAGVL